MSQPNELLRYVVIDSDYETETFRDISMNERSMNERSKKEMVTKHTFTPSTYQDIQQAYLIRQGDKENLEARKEQEGLEEQCLALQNMINLMIKEEAQLKVALRAKQRKMHLEDNRKAQSIEQIDISAIQECRSPILQIVNQNARSRGKEVNEWECGKQKEEEKTKVGGRGVKGKQRENGRGEGKVAKGRWTYQKK